MALNKAIKSRYSDSVLEKMENDSYHNFPSQLDDEIVKNAVKYRLDGRTEYAMKGTINGTDGVYHITYRVSDGKITHRVFVIVILKRDWDRFAGGHELPNYDQI